MKKQIRDFIIDNSDISKEDVEEALDNYLEAENENEKEDEDIEIDAVSEFIGAMFDTDSYEDDIYFWAPEAGEDDD